MHYPHFQCARKGWGWLGCNTVSWPNLQTRGGCSGCKAKRGARAGSLLFWWVYLSPSVSKVKKEINSCVQGLNPSLDKTGRGARPLDVPSLHLWLGTHMGSHMGTAHGSRWPVVFCSIGNHPRHHVQGTRSGDTLSSKYSSLLQISTLLPALCCPCHQCGCDLLCLH